MLESEYLAGTAGLEFFFGARGLRLTQQKLKDAARFADTIERRSKEWVALKRPKQPPKAKYGIKDYDKVLTALDNPMEANPDIAGLPEEYQIDFIAKYLDVRAWLDLHQPALKFSGGLIARELPPSDSEKSKYMWSVNVLDDVTRVFDLLDAGCIAPTEAQAVRDVYPEFIMALMVQYLNTSIEYLYKNEYQSLSGWQMMGLSSLAGVPITSFQDVMTWQGNYEAPSPSSGSKTPDFAKNTTTDMQALGAPA